MSFMLNLVHLNTLFIYDQSIISIFLLNQVKKIQIKKNSGEISRQKVLEQ